MSESLAWPNSLSTMPSYTVTAATGSRAKDGTDNYVYITLVGNMQCSERTLLDKPVYNDFVRMAVSEVTLMYSELCMMYREPFLGTGFLAATTMQSRFFIVIESSTQDEIYKFRYLQSIFFSLSKTYIEIPSLCFTRKILSCVLV